MRMMSKEGFQFSRILKLPECPELPTTAIAPNGKVQTNEGATVFFEDLDFFVTVQRHTARSIAWPTL